MASRGGKREGAGRNHNSKSAINRELLSIFSEKEKKALLKKIYDRAMSEKHECPRCHTWITVGNEKAQTYLADHYIGKAPAQDSKDTGLMVNIFDIMKDKS